MRSPSNRSSVISPGIEDNDDEDEEEEEQETPQTNTQYQKQKLFNANNSSSKDETSSEEFEHLETKSMLCGGSTYVANFDQLSNASHSQHRDSCNSTPTSDIWELPSIKSGSGLLDRSLSLDNDKSGGPKDENGMIYSCKMNLTVRNISTFFFICYVIAR
jgi:hypothetical protein